MTITKIRPGDWITIGNRDAVVCAIFNHTDEIEVVYLDDQERAINEEVHLLNNKWEFVHKGPSGGYADNYARLSEYVSKLRAGRYRNH